MNAPLPAPAPAPAPAPSRPLVDRELEPFLPLLPNLDLNADTLAEMRDAFAQAAPLHAPPTSPDAVTRDEIQIPNPRDGILIRTLVYRPTAPSQHPRPAVLHLHGGGFVLAQPEWNDLRNRFLAADLDCIVISPDYRKPPEVPYPGPVEDAYAALRWLASQPDVDPRRIAVRGESAGGGLAAALALLARDRAQISIAFQHLVYPMLDDRTGTPDEVAPSELTGQFGWNRAANRFAWDAMLGALQPGAVGRMQSSPYAAPSRATNLAGLPPALIQVGALDLFFEEDVAYARDLVRCGVPTTLHVYPGAFHGFDMFPGSSAEAHLHREGHEAMRGALP